MRFRQVVEVALGLAPATLLLPFLLAGAFGTVIAAVAGGTINLATAGLIAWSLAGAAGIAALKLLDQLNPYPRLAALGRQLCDAAVSAAATVSVRAGW
jgi:predicted membrane-bound spermidine synthase